MNALAELLGRSPEMFPFALDAINDTVSFIRLSRTDYEKASFLDPRIVTAQTEVRAVHWPIAAAAIEAANLAEHTGFIFHIGHVGSTLLSRLIGAHPGAFALREPAILRFFAHIQGDPEARPRGWADSDLEARLSACLKLFSRTYDARQRSLVKATSFVSELAANLLQRTSAPRALMMYVSPESYLATILGGPNSRQEAKVLAPSRLQRLHRRLGHDAWSLASLSEGESLALAWACETAALAQAADAAGARVLPVDFDAFLADPAALLFAALRHFDIDATVSDVSGILRGPHMHRYSKAPEHAYDAALRREVLNEARAIHSAEIRRGLSWLRRAAATFPAVRAAVAFACVDVA